MKSFIIPLLLLLFVFSCSKDEKPNPIPENINIKGKLLAPNNQDPIVDAKVVAFQNNITQYETTTDPEGVFVLNISKR